MVPAQFHDVTDDKQNQSGKKKDCRITLLNQGNSYLCRRTYPDDLSESSCGFGHVQNFYYNRWYRL